jgi:hypothetical protein
MKIQVWQLALFLGVLGACALTPLGFPAAATALVGLPAAVGLGAWLVTARAGTEAASRDSERPPTSRARMIPAETASYDVRTWYPRCSRGCHLLVNASFDPHTGETLNGAEPLADRPTRSRRTRPLGKAFERSWKVRVAMLAAIAALGSVAAAATAAVSKSARAHGAGVEGVAAQGATAQPVELNVPQVRSNAFVFAKIVLSDAGFGWHVCGPTQGYPGNLVVSQSPIAGTHVPATPEAPVVRLWLAPNRSYREHGVPDDSGPVSALSAWSSSKGTGLAHAAC